MRSIIAFVLISCLLWPIASIASPKLKADRAAIKVVPSQTRLRSRQPFVLVSTGRAGRELRHINVEVWNAGQHEARAVQVYAHCGRGMLVSLQGPKTLAVNQRAVYISRSKAALVGGVAVSISTGCANCLR